MVFLQGRANPPLPFVPEYVIILNSGTEKPAIGLLISGALITFKSA